MTELAHSNLSHSRPKLQISEESEEKSELYSLLSNQPPLASPEGYNTEDEPEFDLHKSNDFSENSSKTISDGNKNKEVEILHKPESPGISNYTISSGIHEGGFDVGSYPEIGNIPDLNIYQHKKTLAQGMMDLALFSANANQLRYVLESYNRHPYYYPSIVLISISLALQIAVGIGLIWNASYNVKKDHEIYIANRINNFTIIGIFLVTVMNVFISAFGVADLTL